MALRRNEPKVSGDAKLLVLPDRLFGAQNNDEAPARVKAASRRSPKDPLGIYAF